MPPPTRNIAAVPALHHGVESLSQAGHAVAGVGPVLGPLASFAGNALIGVVAGAIVLAAVMLGKRLFRREGASNARA